MDTERRLQTNPASLASMGAMEWLDADGSGGYASGTLSGAPSRRYHGLLLVARYPPHERIMLVNHLTEVLELPAGERVLSDTTTESAGEWHSCVSFAKWPIPTWTYDLEESSSNAQSRGLAGHPT